MPQKAVVFPVHAPPANPESHDISKSRMSAEQVRRLAEFRYQMRKFLHFSQETAESAGLRARQYQLLQVIEGMPEGSAPTIAAVAGRMCLRHNSAVELVDRTIDSGLVRRAPDPIDHRKLLLQITLAGHRVLDSLIEYHLRELEELGPELIRSLKRVLAYRQEERQRRSGSPPHALEGSVFAMPSPTPGDQHDPDTRNAETRHATPLPNFEEPQVKHTQPLNQSLTAKRKNSSPTREARPMLVPRRPSGR